ncbi:hypothetical protein ACNOYE_37280 [Nannocystaceae bacterium ST9]
MISTSSSTSTSSIAGPILVALGLSILFIACGSDEVAPPEPASPSEVVEVAPPEPAIEPDPIALVEDCEALHRRARTSDADVRLLPSLCPNLVLDRAEARRILLGAGDADEVAAQVLRLDAWPELQGIARLALLDRASLPPPSELPDPATALLTPIDDRLLAAVALAEATLAKPDLAELDRTRAHAFLARIHIEALHALGLPPGRPLPPLARLLAAQAMHHGRQFCRFYWQRRVAGLERVFADTELELLALLVDLENTPHAGDSGLLAIERQLVREYLERPGPRERIAALARKRPDAGALDTDLLLPFVHELDRLFDHRLIGMALDRAMSKGGEPNGYGLDPVIAVVTEDLRERDLREYERKLAKRVERARQQVPRARHETGPRELEPELPVEWPSAHELAEQAHRWLSLAHGRAPDFGQRHAVARALQLLDDRPDALIDLLDLLDHGPDLLDHGPSDPVVAAAAPMLLALLDARDTQSLASLRIRVKLAAATRPERETAIRQAYALATRDALMHPR